MDRSRMFTTSAIIAVLLSVISCDYSSPTVPESSAPGPEGAAISITSNGLTPNAVSIASGQSVTFRNDDSVAHEIVSEPVPTYSDCPGINSVGRLEPGQSRQTSALAVTRSCGFLDLLRTSDGRWRGMITVQ